MRLRKKTTNQTWGVELSESYFSEEEQAIRNKIATDPEKIGLFELRDFFPGYKEDVLITYAHVYKYLLKEVIKYNTHGGDLDFARNAALGQLIEIDEEEVDWGAEAP
jgi:hypothetical protein